jgi:hypothetical protein
VSVNTVPSDGPSERGGRVTGSPGATVSDRGVGEFLQLLARAARQFHTYPATSPLCIEAIDACDRAFSLIEGKPLTFRVAPRELIVDDWRVGRDGIVEQELARPLYRARVVSVTIDHPASRRDWSELCAALIRCHRPTKAKTTFAEFLLEAGVAAIVVRMAPRPEVLEIDAPRSVRRLVERERARHLARAGEGPVQYFYPPDKGFIRVDPTVPYETVSLLDLAVLLNDPTELAAILMRLTDDDRGEAVQPAVALEQKYGDVVTLISALDPRLAQLLFAKLARAVLDLDSPRRLSLLRRSILPGLLDCRAGSAAVLTELPDVDLAEALCLLLDLETAAPELLPTAINRLDLPLDRRSRVLPLIKARLAAGPLERTSEGRVHGDLSHYAEALVRINSPGGTSFAEFAAFDLSMSPPTIEALAILRTDITAIDPLAARLSCLVSLARLEPNPALVDVFIERALELLRELVRASRWPEVLRWLTRFLEVVSAVRPSRPDVARAVLQLPERLWAPEVLSDLAGLWGAGAQQRAQGEAIVAAIGPFIVPAWLRALEDAAARPELNQLTPAFASRARELAPAVVRSLPGCGPEALRVAMVLLGAAGPGYEEAIARELPRADERAGREALRALARIGTSKAAALVIDQIEHGPAPVSATAEEALWRLPSALGLAKARELLERPGFVLRRPELATRLLARAAFSSNEALTPLLERLAPLRYRFWNPPVARLGMKARALLQ